jgi:hypothetical protein
MVYDTHDSKAIMGAAFIHYVVYCIFYSIDAIKMADSDDKAKENQDPNVRKAKEKAQQKKDESNKKEPPNAPGSQKKMESKGVAGQGPKGNVPGREPGIDMKEIELDNKKDEKKPGEESKTNLANPGAGLGSGPRQPDRRVNKKDEDDEEDEDLDGYDEEGSPFFTQVVSRFPKSICWFFMILAFAAARAATPFGVACAYLSLIGRIVQVVGAFTKKNIISYIGYGITFFFIFILYFVAMINDAED